MTQDKIKNLKVGDSIYYYFDDGYDWNNPAIREEVITKIEEEQITLNHKANFYFCENERKEVKQTLFTTYSIQKQRLQDLQEHYSTESEALTTFWDQVKLMFKEFENINLKSTEDLLTFVLTNDVGCFDTEGYYSQNSAMAREIFIYKCKEILNIDLNYFLSPELRLHPKIIEYYINNFKQ